MAATSLPLMDEKQVTGQGQSGISFIENLYKTINGTTTTDSGSTATSSSSLDQAGMNAMLKSSLEGTQGLAAVSSMQRGAGGYNSSTNTLLTNDLLSRLTSQIAQNNVSKTTTQGPQSKVVGGVTGGGLLNTAMSVGTGQLLSAGAKKLKGLVGGGLATDALAGSAASGIGAVYGGAADMAGISADVSGAFGSGIAPMASAESMGLGYGMGDSLSSMAAMESGAAYAGLDAAGAAAMSESMGAEGFAAEGMLEGGAAFGPLGAIGALIASQNPGVQEVVGGVVSGVRGITGEIAEAAGCFITTAVCNTLNLPDDCRELTVLREFRDAHMLADPELSQFVKQYYEEAPAMVARINQFDVASIVYESLYGTYVLPAVTAIESGDNAEAVRIYSAMFHAVKQLAGD